MMRLAAGYCRHELPSEFQKKKIDGTLELDRLIYQSVDSMDAECTASVAGEM